MIPKNVFAGMVVFLIIMAGLVWIGASVNAGEPALPPGVKLPPGAEIPPGAEAPGADPEAVKKAEEARRREEIITRYRELLYKKPTHQWAFDKLFRIYVEKNRVDELVADYEELSKTNPDEDPYHVVLARLYDKTDKPDEAAAALDKVKTRDHEVLLLASKVYRKQKNYDRAAEALKTAAEGVKSGRLLKDIYRELGVIYTVSGRRAEAKKTWARIKALAPKNYYNVKKLAELYRRHLYFDEALTEYDDLLKLAGDESARVAEINRDKAEVLEKQEKYEEAIACYEAGIALMARGNWLRAEILTRLVALYQKTGKLEELEKTARSALDKNRQDPAAHEMLARALDASGKAAEAAEVLSEAVKLFPADTVLSTRLRELLSALGDKNALVAEYRRIISEKPDETELYIELGSILAGDKQLAEAKREWERALSRHTDDAAFAAKLAGLYRSYGYDSEAALMYNRAIELAPAEHSYYYSLGELYREMGNESLALTSWERITANNPQSPGAWADLSAVFKSNGYYNRALEALDNACVLAPENYKYKFNKAELLLVLKRPEEASELYRKVAEESGDEYHTSQSIRSVVEIANSRKRLSRLIDEESVREGVVSIRIRAMAHERRTEFSEAMKLYEKALEVDANNVGVIESAARLNARTQQYREAVAMYRRLVELNPGKSRLYYKSLLDILLLLGEEKEASVLVGRMMDANPTNPAVYKEAGRMYQRLGLFDDAMKAFRQATRLKPDNVDYWLALSGVLARVEKEEEAADVLLKALDICRDLKKKFRIIASIHSIYNELGTIEEELDRLRNKTDDNPYDTDTHVFLAELLYHNMEYAEALDVIAPVLELDKGNPVLSEVLARLHGAMDDYASAAETYEKILKMEGADRKRLLEKLGSSYMSAGDKEKAVDTFRRIVDVKTRVRLLATNSFFDEAVEELEEQLTRTPRNHKLRFQLSELYVRKGEKKKALEACMDALAVKPADGMYLMAAANLSFELGNAASAVEFAGRYFGAALEPEDDDDDDDEDSGMYYPGGYYGGGYYGGGYYGGYSSSGVKTGMDILSEAYSFFRRRALMDEFQKFCDRELERQPDNAMLRIAMIGLLGGVDDAHGRVLELARELLRMEIDEKNMPVEYLLSGSIKDDVRFALAALYARNHKLRAEEKKNLEELRENGEADAERLLELAMIYDIEKETDKAAEAIAEAEKKNPDIPVAVLARARIHADRKEWDQASKYYRRLLKVLDERVELLKSKSGYFRRQMKNRVPVEYRNAVTDEMLDFLVAREIHRRASRRSYGRGMGMESYGSAGIPPRRTVILELARIAKSAGEMENATSLLESLEPENDSSPVDADFARGAYAEFEMEEKKIAAYELSMAQEEYRKKLFGELYDRFFNDGYYGGYMRGMRGMSMRHPFGYDRWGGSRDDDVVDYYLEKGERLKAVVAAMDRGYGLKELLGREGVWEKALEGLRAAVETEKALEMKGEPSKYRKAVVRLGTLYCEKEKRDELNELYREYLEICPGDLRFLKAVSVMHESRGEFDNAAEVLADLADRARKDEMRRKRKPVIMPWLDPVPCPHLKESGMERERWGYYGDREMKYFFIHVVVYSDCLLDLARVYAKAGERKAAVDTIKKYYVENKKNQRWAYDNAAKIRQFVERFQLEDEMAPVYRTVMILYPSDHDTRLLYARYLEKHERWKEAIKIYEKLLKQRRSGYYHGYWGGYSEETDLASKLEKLYRRLGRKSLTVADLREKALNNPKNVLAAQRVLVCEILSGEISAARDRAVKMLEIAPYDPKLYRILYHLSCALGEDEKALQYLDQVIKLTPEGYGKKQLYSEYGAMLYLDGKQDKAIETWRKALVNADESEYSSLGNLMLELGRYELAAELFEKGIEHTRSYSGYYWGGGLTNRYIVARILSGDFDNAVEYFLDHLEKGKKQGYSNESFQALVAAATKVGKAAEFEKALEDKAAENSDKEEWIDFLLTYYSLPGKDDETREKRRSLYQKKVEMHPDKPDSYQGLFGLAMFDNNWDEAFRLAEKMFELGRTHVGSAFSGGGKSAQFLEEMEKEYRRTLSRIHSAKGDKKKAFEELKKNLEPDKPETYMELARSAYNMDLENESLAMVRKYFEKAKTPSPSEYSWYATRLAELFKFDDALSALENALAISGDGWEKYNILNSMETLYKRTGRTAEFAGKLEKLIDAAPGSANQLEDMLLETYQYLGAEEKRQAFIRNLYEKDPGNHRYVGMMVRMLENKEKYDEAVDLLENLLDKKPRNPVEIYAKLSYLNFMRLDNAAAVRWLEKQHENRDRPALDVAETLFRRELYKDALDKLAPLDNANENDTYYNMFLAKIAMRLDDFPLCWKALRRCVDEEGWAIYSPDWRSMAVAVFDNLSITAREVVEDLGNATELLRNKRLYMYYYVKNEHEKAFELAGKILDEEKFNKRFLYARMFLGRLLGNDDAVLEAAVRLSRLLENGGDRMDKRLLKQFLFSNARSSNPFSTLSLDSGLSYPKKSINRFIGDLYLARGDVEEADKWWKKTLNINALNSGWYSGGNMQELYEIYRSRGLIDKMKELEKARRNMPRYSYYSHDRDSEKLDKARDMRWAGDLENATRLYEEFLAEHFEENRENYFRNNYYGGRNEEMSEFIQTLYDSGRLTEYFEKARKLSAEEKASPFYVELFEMLTGELMIDDPSLIEEVYLRKFRKRKDDDENMLHSLAWFYWNRDLYEKCYEVLHRKLETWPVDRYDDLKRLYVCCLKTGRIEEAAEVAQEYLGWNTIKPEKKVRLENLFTYAAQEELYNNAFVWAGKLLENDASIDKEEERFSWRYAETLRKMYETLGMEKEMKEAAATVEKQKAEIEAAEEKRLDVAREYVKLYPSMWWPHSNLHAYYRKKGEFDKAREHIHKIAENFGPSVSNYTWLGFYRMYAGEYEKAVELFKQVEEWDNSFEGFPSTEWPIADTEHTRYQRSSYSYSYGSSEHMSDLTERSNRWSWYYSNMEATYELKVTYEYGMAMACTALGKKDEAKKYFHEARKNIPRSVFRMFADKVIENRPVDWERYKKTAGDYYEFYKKFEEIFREE